MTISIGQLEELVRNLYQWALKAWGEGNFSEYFRLRKEMGLAEAELRMRTLLSPRAA